MKVINYPTDVFRPWWLGIKRRDSGPIPPPPAPSDPSDALIQTHFGAGQIGTMVESRPTVNGIQVLWVDQARTIPAENDGDLVYVRDDISGNGNHAVARTSAARATLRTDGTHWWLEYTGSQGYIVAGVNWLANAGDVSQTSGMGLRPADSTGYFVHGAGSVSHLPSTKFALLMQSQQLKWLFSTSSEVNNTPWTPGTDVATSSATVRTAAGELYGGLSINGNAREALVSTGIDEDGAVLTVGFRTPSSPSAFYQGRDYGLLVSSGYRAMELGRLDAYYAELAGITL